MSVWSLLNEFVSGTDELNAIVLSVAVANDSLERSKPNSVTIDWALAVLLERVVVRLVADISAL